ncbi:formate dehydrogenase accessory sulfurtransferase FdhD [Nesterenkonia sp. LB17]|uniref:formate dehydrogenase accessory sulfurtransferase FdhD n=1 Tax=unclassified Nesterenkonia TaxID=2629769 RepID=UPI001F4C68D5|nr:MULTISPECIES: formate dehydrogenase accessory sulfurtransferase FdhD [unclassified Nesterenkonia]MCH8560661.1 formate dehydrogenase accessory sulfurtransferase FdhD [Nesterenkonia sp. DZ6]MCH8562939.1 formate dehydrogenase accessory sulfurtransferase FdhD [Nesterenkonia sp. YGD6]MCH8565977.1 formate dehydrogenase accessory sulfurtransferase FdhD [Nesterenkonia sp. LB17]MCH8570769.1 formate dehydrogenase accessory sulfurtransferase FdhD [Nesterenkonia sp. AY15]
MGRLIERRRVITLRADGTRSKIDLLAVEEPLELRLAGESFTVTMRTPGHDFELVAGFLVAEGIISSQDHLRSLRYCAGTDEQGNQTYNVIDAELDPALAPTSLLRTRNVLTTSACGICGTTSIDAVEKTLPPCRTDMLRLSPSVLLELPELMRERQTLFGKTGGVHAAGLFDADGALLCLREDVGRHNAVDKVVGWALTQGRLPLSGTALQVSGRASFELVQKAALAGIEMLSAVGAPSSLAVDLAERSGVTLAGFSRGGSINLYTHSQRVEMKDEKP